MEIKGGFYSESNSNLVPDIVNPSPDYYCTWQTQLYYANNGGPQAQRDSITEENLFGIQTYEGWANFYPNARQDLIFVMDDSWDIPFGFNEKYLGSLVLNRQKFPNFASCDLSPQEALKKLSDKIKNIGWKCLGGWVCAQESSELYHAGSSEQYWTERLQWAEYAGMGYWKVDWGLKDQDYGFRKMLSDLSHLYAPNLVVENAKNTHNISVSDVFRTYDVPAIMSIPATMEKLTSNLSYNTQQGYKGIINCEDEVYIAAALGCTMGIMRHPMSGNLPNGLPDPSFPSVHRNLKTKTDEITRAVRWHRIAPAFGVNASETNIDVNWLVDSWDIQCQEAEVEAWWGHKTGETVFGKGPARISRRMQLPEVIPDINGHVPYVVASRNPCGAVSVCTLARTINRLCWTPRCDITIFSEDSKVFGIFGYYRNLTIHAAYNLEGSLVKAQDLRGIHAKDITSRVRIDGKCLTISGSVIEEIGTEESTKGDTSEPGLVLVIS